MDKNEKMNEGFRVCEVTRLDVAQALIDGGMNKEDAEAKAEALEEFDMETLAGKMNDAFCETDVYWQAIRCWMEGRE